MSGRWSEVDAYLVDRLVGSDPAQDATLAANAEAGLPAIDVSPLAGKLLYLLARLGGVKRILEVGTLGGFSTTWLARAIPADGKVTTLEIDPKHAKVARQNLIHAGVSDRVEIVLGPAAESLAKLSGTFDLVFIDADKPSNPIYWREALRLTRPGSLIIVDNVVRDGRIVDADTNDPSIQGVRELLDLISEEPRVQATALQTVGIKGYDGLLVARVV